MFISSIIAWIYWNPKKEIFILPIVDWPIVWYSLFFVIGFLLAYYIFQYHLKFYCLFFPKFSSKDVSSFDHLQKILKKPTNKAQKLCIDHLKLDNKAKSFLREKKEKKHFLKVFNQLFEKSELITELKKLTKEKKLFYQLEKINRSILPKQEASLRLILEDLFFPAFLKIKKKVLLITDRLLIYMVIATVIGARLGHFIFYEDPKIYLSQPLEIFKTWHGGLSSHGAVIAILIALFIFCRYFLKRFSPKIGWVTILDLVSTPVALTAVFIRLGNFFNQEILGKPSNVPWAILFADPMEPVAIVPRHPAQLYEAICYLIIFIGLSVLCRKTKILLKKGKVIGLFLIFVFLSRFFVEFFKIPQSALIESDSLLLMGHYLSIPVILLGIIFFFFEEISKIFKKEKTN